MNRQIQNNICDQLLNFDHHSYSPANQPEESVQRYYEELFLNVPSPVNWVYEDIYLENQPVSDFVAQEEQESIVVNGAVTRELMTFNFISKRLRIVEKFMIAQAQEQIYEFDPQFDSDDQGSQVKNKSIKFILINPQQQKVVVQTEKKQKNIKVNQANSEDHSIQIFNFLKKVKLLELFQNMKRITNQQKHTFIQLRNIISDIKNHLVIQQDQNKDKSQHKCKICKAKFKNGRQLGGHMSRKHPGSSFDYATKKQVQFIKKLEKERRDYFKANGLLMQF